MKYLMFIALVIQNQSTLTMEALAKKQHKVAQRQALVAQLKNLKRDRTEEKHTVGERKGPEGITSKENERERQALEQEFNAFQQNKSPEVEKIPQLEVMITKASHLIRHAQKTQGTDATQAGYKELKDKISQALKDEHIKLEQAQKNPSYKPLYERESYAYAPRALLIYLDHSETESQKSDYGIATGVTTLYLSKAIREEAGPIIASTHTLWLLRKEQERVILSKKEKLDTSWILKQISHCLVLLVPKNYLTSINIDPADVKKSDTTEITQTELMLGIKVNHMKTVTFDNLTKDKPEIQDLTYDFISFFTGRNTIFCLRSDYENHKKKWSSYLPMWSLFMQGHGGSDQIVGIKLDSFALVLDFLDTRINTRLLVYSSCYAAGINAKRIYYYSESAIQKTYSFPIITGALTDATTISVVSDTKPKALVQELMKPVSDPLNYEKIVSYFKPIQRDPENTALIKIPGLEWFSVIDIHKDVVQIGSILAETRSNRPLDIVKFFHRDPRILLLYAQDIPFELIINSKNLKSIVSMIPGNIIHTIEKITSSSDLGSVLDWFMYIDSLSTTKIFYIKSINKPDGTVLAKEVVICNNYAEYYSARFALFKKDDGKLYVKECFIEIGQIPDKYKAQSLIRMVESNSKSTVFQDKVYSEAMYQKLLYMKQIDAMNQSTQQALDLLEQIKYINRQIEDIVLDKQNVKDNKSLIKEARNAELARLRRKENDLKNKRLDLYNLGVNNIHSDKIKKDLYAAAHKKISGAK